MPNVRGRTVTPYSTPAMLGRCIALCEQIDVHAEPTHQRQCKCQVQQRRAVRSERNARQHVGTQACLRSDHTGQNRDERQDQTANDDSREEIAARGLMRKVETRDQGWQAYAEEHVAYRDLPPRYRSIERHRRGREFV
jgi:hypothetical protein